MHRLLAVTLTLATLPAAAGTLTISSRCVNTCGGEVVLVRGVPVDPHLTAFQVELKTAERAGGQTPPVASLDVHSGQWFLTGSAAGLYVERQNLFVGTGSQSVVLTVWQTATVSGQARPEVPIDSDVPVSLRWTAGGSHLSDVSRCRHEGRAFKCEVPAVGAAEVQLNVRGFAPIFASLNLESRADVHLGSLVLLKGASVFGRIATGKSRATDIVVRLATSSNSNDAQESRPLYTVVPDRRGRFMFTGVPPGRYSVTAVARSGAASGASVVDVVEGKQTEIVREIVLESPHSLTIDISPAISSDARRWTIRLQRAGARRAWDLVTSGLAGENGSWSAARLRPARYRLDVISSDKSVVASRPFDLNDQDAALFIEVAQTSVRGSVHYGDEPLRDAIVWLGGRGRVPTVRVLTDSDGTFSGVAPFPLDAVWNVTVEKRSPRIIRDFAEKPAVQDGEAVLALKLSGSGVRGIVEDENGVPCEKAIVNLTSPDESLVVQAHTSAGGLFEISALPAGKFKLQAIGFDRRQSDRISVEVADDVVAESTLVLKSAVSFRGRVLAGAIGSAGALVIAVPTNREAALWPQTTTAADGLFELDLPPGTDEIDLVVSAPGMALKSFHLPVGPEAVSVHVSPEGGGLTLDLPGPPAPGSATAVLIHQGTVLPAFYLTSMTGAEVRRLEGDAISVAHGMMEAGAYTLCTASSPQEIAAFRTALPQDRCVSGVLAPFGTLQLGSRHPTVPKSGG